MEKRRHDIDWIRVIAIGLLLLYHTAITFQPWGTLVGFITSERPWIALWLPMSLLNVWRIPLLFFVSGMGVYFALRNRNWKQLLLERTKRILLPCMFGMVAIVPIHVCLWQYYYQFPVRYTPSPGHLWFLGNLFCYVVLLLPLFYWLKHLKRKRLLRFLVKLLQTPMGLLPMLTLFIAEALILQPKPFELYAMTVHGFFWGLLAFFFGFFFVWCGAVFWNMLLRWRWLFFSLALGLFITRISLFHSVSPLYLIAVESNCWVLAVFAFGYRHLNHPSKTLRYLSDAAYPIYILHMIFLYSGSFLIFSIHVPVPVQFTLLLFFTIFGCFVSYEGVVKRVGFLRLLFGLNRRKPIAQSTL